MTSDSDSPAHQRMDRALARRQLKRRLEGRAYALLRRLVGWALPARQPGTEPGSILLVLRGQRYGDAVVSLAFSASVRQHFPKAEIWAVGPPALESILSYDTSLSGYLPLPHAEWRHPLAAVRSLHRIRSLDSDMAFALGIHFFTCFLSRLAARHAVGYDYNGRGFVLDRAIVPHVSCNRSGWEYGADTEPPHITRFWARLLDDMVGGETGVSWSGLDLSDHEPRASAFIADHLAGDSPLVVVHPWASSAIRTWPTGHVTAFLRTVAASTDWRIVVSGGPEHAAQAAELVKLAPDRIASAAGTLTLAETWAVLEKAAAVVSVDTVTIHMAAAVATPLISLFGPGDPLVWGPHGQLERVVQPNDWCCRCKRASCVHPGLPCMEAIEPEMVLEHVRQVLRD